MKTLKLFLISLFLFTVFSSPVKADSLVYQRLTDMAFNLNANNKAMSGNAVMFRLDNRIAYCIEPGTDITVSSYKAYSGFDKTKLTKEKQNKIEKIGYYGYEYPNHQTDKYYAATQELIWKTFDNVDIYWTSQKNGQGYLINIDKEKNEILDLVNSHDLKPSFYNEYITGESGKTITLTDTNNVLDKYEIEIPNHHEVKIENNKLIIKFSDDIVEEQIKLRLKKYDSLTSLVYYEEGSQTLASLRLSSEEAFNLTIKSQEIPEEVEIYKVPNTSDNLIVKHFNIIKFKVNNEKRFT